MKDLQVKVPCPICKGARLFFRDGLISHTAAKHKFQKVIGKHNSFKSISRSSKGDLSWDISDKPSLTKPKITLKKGRAATSSIA